MLRDLAERSPLGQARSIYRYLLAEVENVRAAQALAPLQRTYLPISPWSLNAFHLQYVCFQLETAPVGDGPAEGGADSERPTVLEFGAGSSSPVLATVARDAGYRFLSIEVDPHWAMLARRWFERSDLDPDLVHLVPLDTTSGWHDEAALGDIVDGHRVTHLLVDGPHGQGPVGRRPVQDWARRMQFPLEHVFIDDCHREGERTTAERFATWSGATLEYVGAKAEFAHIRWSGT